MLNYLFLKLYNISINYIMNKKMNKFELFKKSIYLFRNINN